MGTVWAALALEPLKWAFEPFDPKWAFEPLKEPQNWTLEPLELRALEPLKWRLEGEGVTRDVWYVPNPCALRVWC